MSESKANSFNKDDYIYIIGKAFIFVILFIIIHYLELFLPDFLEPALIYVTEVSEALYQHFKMGFINWILLLVLEFVIFSLIRKTIKDKSTFVFSRLLTSFILSWIIFTVFMSHFFLVYDFTDIWIEIIWAISATFVAGLIGAFLDKKFEEISYPTEFKILIIILVLISYIQFVLFSFNPPPSFFFTY